MKITAAFQNKNRIQNQTLSARLLRPLFIAFIALACVAMASYSAPAEAQTENEVASDWALIPSGLSGGDTFRLLIVTSTRQAPTATAISAYDTVVQRDVTDTGHTAITSYASNFKMLGCTQTTSAIANTATASTDTSAPIYWLNGQKVADDYADLYDETWDSNEPRLPDGTILSVSGFAKRTSTGCDSDGTIHSTNYLGADEVIQGIPTDSGAELSHSKTENSSLRRYYGLSPGQPHSKVDRDGSPQIHRRPASNILHTLSKSVFSTAQRLNRLLGSRSKLECGCPGTVSHIPGRGWQHQHGSHRVRRRRNHHGQHRIYLRRRRLQLRGH